MTAATNTTEFATKPQPFRNAEPVQVTENPAPACDLSGFAMVERIEVYEVFVLHFSKIDTPAEHWGISLEDAKGLARKAATHPDVFGKVRLAREIRRTRSVDFRDERDVEVYVMNLGAGAYDDRR